MDYQAYDRKKVEIDTEQQRYENIPVVPGNADARNDLAAHIRGLRNDLNRITETWAETVANIIKKLTKTYQQTRPQEPRAELYSRILQLVYKKFRGHNAEAMGPSRATQFLTFVLAGTGDISSSTFQDAFNIVVQVMLMDFRVPDNLQSASAAVVGPLQIPGAADPANPAPGEEPDHQVLTWLLCLLHGIEVRHNNSADTSMWHYVRNGSLLQHGEITPLIRKYYKESDDAQAEADKNVFESLISNFEESRESCMDLQYNLHVLQRPAFEVPNPCILNTFVHKVSNNNVIPVGTEATAHRDVDDAHNFKSQYMKYILQDVEEFGNQTRSMLNIFESLFEYYNHLCSNWAAVNPIMPASTYIQNNQTEIPAIAYHGNVILDKIKGGRDEVRCVGHLGNSFPGCACIREGKGMLNTYQSMPTAVHVM